MNRPLSAATVGFLHRVAGEVAARSADGGGVGPSHGRLTPVPSVGFADSSPVSRWSNGRRYSAFCPIPIACRISGWILSTPFSWMCWAMRTPTAMRAWAMKRSALAPTQS